MIRIEHEDGIARITLSAPPLNILNRSLLHELRDALIDLRQEGNLRVLLLGAEGRHFSAGAAVDEHLPPECGALLGDFAAAVLALHEFPLPVIAAVQGRCLGGVVLGTRRFIRDELEPYVKHTGPAMSPFNAWVMLKGLETLALRANAQTDAAEELVGWVQAQGKVTREVDSGGVRRFVRT